MSEAYVHGYHPRENERLQDQAGTLVDLLHFDTAYPSLAGRDRAGTNIRAIRHQRFFERELPEVAGSSSKPWEDSANLASALIYIRSD